MNFNIIAFSFCFLAFQPLLFAQDTQNERQRQVDSLISVIPTMSSTTEKVSSLNLVSELLIGVNDSLSNTYARQALKLARKLPDPVGIALAFDHLAKVEKRNNNPEGAIPFFDSCLFYFEKAGRTRSQGIVENELGIMRMNLSQLEKSREHFINSEKLFLSINDSAKLAEAYSNIGLTYDNQGMHATALVYYFKCLEIDEKMKNDWGIASDFTSIGITLKKQKELEESELYFNKSLKIYTRIEDDYGVAQVQANMGILYKDQRRLEEGIAALNKAMETFKRLGDVSGEIVCLHNLATIYYEQQNYEKALYTVNRSAELDLQVGNRLVMLNNHILVVKIYNKEVKTDKAIEVAKEALKEADEMDLLEEKFQVTSLLAEAYKVKGEYRRAVETLENAKVLSDSIFNLGKSRQMQELQTRYEASKKESEIALLNQEKTLQESELKRKTQLQNVTYTATGVFVLVAFFLFRSFTSRQKYKRALLDRQLQEEKLEAARLQDLDEVKSRFFANIAHEFRTPLTLILGPAEQILTHQPDQRTTEYTEMIRENGHKMLALINQLLDLIKLESGMISLYPVRSDFLAYVRGYVFSFESLAEEKDITITLKSDQDQLYVDFDKEKMGIVISNLMSNALKFTDPFGEVIITVNKDATLPHILIEVSDNGTGISSDQLPFVFDRFYQADNSHKRKTQGTGIGLALVRELIELHGGNVRVESDPGAGTRFILQLPEQQENILPETDVKIDVQPDYEPWAVPARDHQQLTEGIRDQVNVSELETILVIEDNRDVRRFISSILEESYHIIEAGNGQEGLEIAIEQIPDIIISDVMMPVMDGFGLCQKIKEDERTNHIPVIMLTAKSGMESKINGLVMGAEEYLAKPFNGRELLVRIKNLIRARKRIQEKYSMGEEVPAEKENSFITRLKEVIDQNLDREDFSVVELGSALAMSRTQVHRKLKALINLSTSQFIRQYKLSKALELLKESELNVSEVAYTLGFNTPNYFSTCFTAQYGYPPSDIKRQ